MCRVEWVDGAYAPESIRIDDVAELAIDDEPADHLGQDWGGSRLLSARASDWVPHGQLKKFKGVCTPHGTRSRRCTKDIVCVR